MKRFMILCTAVVVIALTASTPQGAGATANIRALGPATPSLTATPILTSLPFPAAFTFLPDGRLLYGERNSGRILLYDLSTKQKKVVFTVSKVQTNGEQGLLGLAVDPSWPRRSAMYAYATRSIQGQLFNEILRIKVVSDVGTSFKVIFKSDTTAGNYHDGGHIAFGPDRKLYAVVGEGHSPANAQNLTNDAGKVLRMTAMGKIPTDNPFAGSRIFAYGLRNSFGFTFDPQSGLLWETENGPECNDEVNVERSGENHAWGPSENCNGQSPDDTNQDGPQPRIFPLAWFGTTIAPTGVAFCDGCGLPNAEGALFFGAFNTGQIRRVKLTGDRQGISSMAVVLNAPSSVLSMQAAPDGGLYFSTPDAIYQIQP